jgi:hypothetical protein
MKTVSNINVAKLVFVIHLNYFDLQTFTQPDSSNFNVCRSAADPQDDMARCWLTGMFLNDKYISSNMLVFYKLLVLSFASRMII